MTEKPPSPPIDPNIKLSMMLPALYVNNVSVAAVAGGIKVTFVDGVPEGISSPRATLFLPGDFALTVAKFLQEIYEKAQQVSLQPETSHTRN